MPRSLREVVFVDGVRTPFGKSGPKGIYAETRADDLVIKCIRELLRRHPELPPAKVEEVAIAATTQIGDQGLTLGRTAALLSGLPKTVPGYSIDRMCAGAMTAVASTAGQIAFGAIDVAIAGGVEHMGRHPMGEGVDPNPRIVAEKLVDPSALVMGKTAENLHDRYPQLTKERSDAFAVASQDKLAAAYQAGKIQPDLVPVATRSAEKGYGLAVTDEPPRPGTTLDDLGALKTPFRAHGRVTAGNAAGINDGATACLLAAEDTAKELGLPIRMRLVEFAFVGVEPEVMGIGPVPATEKALAKAGLTIADIGLFELNEAFAVQVLAFLDHFGIADDDPRVNPYGGAIATGHPLASSGVRLMTQLANHFEAHPDVRYGLTAMCIGLGMGGAVIWENPNHADYGKEAYAMTETLAAKAATQFPDEVVTKALVRDLTLPAGAGTMALITLDNGFDHTKPNTFGPATIAGLTEVVASLQARAEAGEIQAVGITGKPFIFAVGADLTAVPAAREREQALEIARAGHTVFGAIMDLPVPTFAFVNGAAMGGGVEIALACDYRTISAGVPAVALPEAFLGLVPGWGGCYLLPNLVGVQKALTVIIENPMNTNKMLSGPAAFKLGMADAMFAPADFLEESLTWAAGVLSGSVSVNRPEVDRDETTWNTAVDMAKALVDVKTGGKSPAPYRALDLVRAARTAERSEAFAGEDEALGDLVMGDELRAGLYSFDLVQRRAKRPAGAPDRALARPVTKVGIVGAGLMASQLALLFAQRLEVPVVMTDLDQERVDKGIAYVQGQLADRLAKGRMTQDAVNKLTGLIGGATSKDGFADADFVIEAVFEEISVKKQVFAEVEAVVSPEAILATNTSSLSITEMAADLEHPERVVGFHFFNPVAVMPLLEIIPGEKTDDAALATAFAVGKALKKTTIRVKDSASFIVNRLLGRFMGEYSKIVDEGTPVAVADQAVAGMAPMPPYVLLSLVGPAIALHNVETLRRAFGDRFYVSPSMQAVVAAKKPGFDPSLQVVPEHPVELTVPQVRERVLSAIAEEVGLMLADGVAQAPMDIDLAMITGAGFQFWNGGICPLLDREGISEKVLGRRLLPPGAASVPA